MAGCVRVVSAVVFGAAPNLFRGLFIGLFIGLFTSAQAQTFDPPLCERSPAVQFALLVTAGTDGGCAAFDPSTLQGRTALDLSGRSIRELKSRDFNGLGDVETFNLSGNRLESLPVGVFDGLTGVQTLDLSDNRLESLPAGAFDGLTGLRTLDLSDNRLESLPMDVFDGLTGVQTLDLSDNRLQGALEGNRFTGLGDLRRLDLSDNRLQDLEADLLRNTPKLKQLDLRNNRLEFLRAKLFEGRDFNPSAVDGYRGSLLLSGNPGPDGDPETPFALVVQARAVDPEVVSKCYATVRRGCSGRRSEHNVSFEGYLAQGAPFDLDVEWSVKDQRGQDVLSSIDNSPLSTLSFPAGESVSDDKQEVRHSTRPHGGTPTVLSVRVSFESFPLPRGDCGDSPCYDGFEIRGTTDNPNADCDLRPGCYVRRGEAAGLNTNILNASLNLPDDVNWPRTEVSDVRFVSTPQEPDGYVVGRDTITVEVVFDRRIVVVEGKPELVVRIGSVERRAAYVPSEAGSNAMRFRYRLSRDDPADGDGIEVLRIDERGATIDDMLVGHNVPDLDLRNHGGRFSSQKAQRVPLLSFEAATAAAGKGVTVELRFTLDPPPSAPITVHFSVAGPVDVGIDGGTVELAAGANSGIISIPIDADVEVGGENDTFTVSLQAPTGYLLGIYPAVTVNVAEGVCDRTLQVRDALVNVTGRDDCVEVTREDLAAVVDLDLSGRGIERLSPRDFRGLSGLRGLDLRNNELQILPAGIFEGLAGLGDASGYLLLENNPGAPFDFVFQMGIVGVRLKFRLPGSPDPDEELVTVRPYLAQGAPFDLIFETHRRRVDPADTDYDFPFGAGDLRGSRREANLLSELTVRGYNSLSFNHDAPPFLNLPSLPRGGCGLARCYTGFGFSSEGAGETIYRFMEPRGTVSVNRFEFTSRPQDADGYVAGVETVIAEVGFNDKLILEPSQIGGMPSLELRIGDRTRVASYVPAPTATDVWRFTYALREDDVDVNGIRAASRDGLKLNGATGAGLIREFRSDSVRLPDNADDTDPGHKVQPGTALSFDAATVSPGEDSILELPLNVSPAARSAFVVEYVVEGADFDYAGRILVAVGSRREVIRIPVGADGEAFEVWLRPSDDYFLFSPSRTSVTVKVGICDRTPQVRDELLSVLGKNDCADVSNQDLARVDGTLDLNDSGIASLRPEDFSGLTNLERLLLNDNRLQGLPSGLFEGLGNLGTLEFRRNQLQSLRRDAFSGLGNLNRLRLQGNRLSSLPPGVFSGVGRSGWWLFLSDNPLSSLPAGVFSGTAGLEWLSLGNNAMTELPAGIFSGISENLRALVLEESGQSAFGLALRFEFAGGADMQLRTDGSGDVDRVPVKLTVREGAAYRLRGSLDVFGGTASVSNVEIPPGAMQSETFEVSLTDASTFSMRLNNPSLPPENCPSWQRGADGRCFSGLEIVPPAPFILSDVSADTSVCDRPQAVQDALIQLWSGNNCTNLPTDLLRIATYLDLSDADLSGLTSDDFAGMASLERLDLSGSRGLQALGANAFGDLVNLKRLDLSSMGLRTLDPRAFAGLESLEQLLLHDNDLRELPAGIFSGLSGLGVPSGSLRVEDNPDASSPRFVLPAVFRVAQVAGDALDFHLHLAQGAPFELSFPLTAQGTSSPTPPTMVIRAGSTRSETVSVTRQAGRTLRLSLGDPPALPQGDSGGNSGCGYAPCYAGFEIASGPPLVYDGTRSSPRITAVEFSAPSHFADGYVAGVETMIVDVIFDKALIVDTTNGAPTLPPTLKLQVGRNLRSASYLPGQTDVDRLRFSYALASSDVDDDGVHVVSGGLELNGATVRDAFGVNAALSLAGFLDPVADRKVRQTSWVSFETSSVSSTEGAMVELPFRLDPPAPPGLTVGYRVGAPGDVADADDYGDGGSGVVSGAVAVGTGATRGTVRIQIRDDEVAEPVEEFFTVSLSPSDDYFVVAPSTARVVIVEGVCDRTPRVREALTPSRFSGCAAVTEAYLSSLRDLDLSSTRMATVKQGDFLGLTGLERLSLNANFLRSLPEGVFSGLKNLEALHLGANPGSSFSFPLRVELAGGPQAPLVANQPVPVRLTLRHGAPYVLTVEISFSGGSSSTPSVTIKAGRTQSEVFFVTRALDAMDLGVTLSVSSPPDSCASGLQQNGQCFTGFDVTPDDRSFRATPGSPGSAPTVCDRTPGIRDAILRLPGSPASCVGFPYEALGFAPYLDARNVGLSAVSRADLVPMIRLQDLDLSGNARLQALGESVFADLGDLRRLDLSSGGLRELHPRAFTGLGRLEQLLLQDNDLQTLPAGIFEGLAGLGEASGSLRLEGNAPADGSSNFTLTAQLEAAGSSGDDLDFHLYLAEGAPFDLTFPLTATGSVGSVPSTVGISAGSTRSETVRATRAAGQTLELSLGAAPALPQGDLGGDPQSNSQSNSSCGYDPCYAGFEIASGEPLVYSRALPPPPRVTGVEFSAPRYFADAYLNDGADPGGETFTVDVIFDRELNVDVSNGEPRLLLEIAGSASTTTYASVAGLGARLRFSYAVGCHSSFDYCDSDDNDGVHAASADALHLDGAVVADAFGTAADLSLADVLNVSGPDVRTGGLLRFDAASVEVVEGETLELGLTASLIPQTTITASYRVGAPDDMVGDVATADDYADDGNGEVDVGVARTPIRISIRDDEAIEAPRERFTVSLIDSGSDAYFLASPTTVTVTIKEGVCDRTEQVRDALTTVAGADACADVTASDLFGQTELDLSEAGIASLKGDDFSGLPRLRSLRLDDNDLRTLPAGIFAGLDLGSREGSLHLRGNPDAVSPDLVFTVELRFVRFVADDQGGDRAELVLYLAQGAPFDVTVPLVAEGATGSPVPSEATIPAGEVQSARFSVGRQAGKTATLRLGAPVPAFLPRGDCGTPPCYSGFRIAASETPFVYDDSPVRRVESVEFTPPPQYLEDGYIAGLETVVVEVVFDGELLVNVAGGEPSLTLQVGEVTRTATYIPSPASPPGAGNTLSFSYALAREDLDADGLSVASAQGLRLNGATVTGNSLVDADASLARFVASPAADRKVHRSHLVSFSPGNPTTAMEGDDLIVSLNVRPAPLQRQALVVRVGAGRTGDVADAADYSVGDVETSVIVQSVEVRAFSVSIVDNREIDPPSRFFTLYLPPPAPGDDYVVGSPSSLRITISEPGICDRTPVVRDAVLSGLGRTDCESIDSVVLAEFTGTLDLSSTGITALQSKDFSGLVNVEELILSDNALQTLPEGVFAGLGALETLNLSDNQLQALRTDAFAGLGELAKLFLSDNELRALPAGTFAGLGELRELHLHRNPRLSRLSPGLFSDLGSLEWLSFYGDDLSELPAGVFVGLSSLRALRLENNPGTPFPLTLGFEIVGGSAGSVHLRATLREGAPYRLEVGLEVTRGVSSHSVQAEIPAGNTHSGTFTESAPSGMTPVVLRFSGATAHGTEDCTNLQRHPTTNECFVGLEIDSGARLTLDNAAADPPICDRTPGIRDAILDLGDGAGCADFPTYVLRNALRLDASAAGLSGFERSDFNDMESLERLDLSGNAGLQALGANAFGEGLTGLKRLDLSSGGLNGLHPQAFAGLSDLGQLLLHDNDLLELPAGIFAGLSGLGGVSGSLRLEGNPDDDSPGFVLTAEFQVVSTANDRLEFNLYLAQGAPFEVSFPLIAAGSTPAFSTTPTLTIPAGSTRSSETLSLTRQAGQTLRLSLGAPSSLPQGDSGCGYVPCYAGFEIVPGEALAYEGGSRASPAPRATTVRFSSPRYLAAGYVAGLETIFVDVVFDKGLIVDTSGGTPWLRLRVGGRERRADYLPGRAAGDVLRFGYALAAGDLGNVRIASVNGLELNGATVRDAFGTNADLSLPGNFLSSTADRQVIATYLVSFDLKAVSTEEGRTTLDLSFTVAPPARSALSVSYRVGAPGDTADGGDYTDLGAGTVTVRVGATRGMIRISIRDDDEIEPSSEFFTVSLTPPTRSGYTLVSPSAVTVEITEGICDRTPEVQSDLLSAISPLTGVSRCADVTEGDLARITATFYVTGPRRLKRGDFAGLSEVSTLFLDDNKLTTLPAGTFAGLDKLTFLSLENNRLTALPVGAFAGLDKLTSLSLENNQLTALPVGAFAGLDKLTSLSLENNQLTALPAGTFDGLGELTMIVLNNNQLTTLPAGTFDGLDKLAVLYLNGNQFARLPRGVFRGISNLDALHLGGNPGAEFELAVHLEPVARARSDGSLSLRATLREGAPYRLRAGVAASDAEIRGLPDGVVTIPAGEVHGETFLVSPTGRSPVLAFVALSSPPLGCHVLEMVNGRCFSGFTVDWDTEFSLDDDVAPDVSGVMVEVDKEAVAHVHFSERTFVIPGADGRNPTLSLEIGGEERTAVYDEDLSSTATLTFRYALRSNDKGLRNVVVPNGALVLNGASITDLADNSADLSYFNSLTPDDYSVEVSAAAARREVELVFSPDVVDVSLGSRVAFTLETIPAFRVGESATVTLTAPPGISLDGAGQVLTLNLDGEMTRREVSVSTSGGARSGLVTAAWEGFAGFEPVPPQSSLAVNPVSVTFTPSTVNLEQGSSVAVSVATMPELSPDQSAMVTLTAQAGLSFDGGGRAVTLHLDGATTRREVRVGVNLDAPPGEIGITAALSGSGFAPADEQPSLSVNVTLRAVSVSVEFDVDEAVLTVSDDTIVTLRLGETPGLYPGEALEFIVTIEGPGLDVSRQNLSLTESEPGTVLIFAQTPGARGTLTVTSARPAAVRLGETALPVRVERDLRLSFDPAEVVLRAGGSSEVVALTLERNELLEPHETVVVTLTPSPGLEVRSESGESLTMVTLGRGAGATTRVRVSANLDADYATPDAESLNAAAAALPNNARVAESTLRVTVAQREIRVSFEPGRITLVRGGASATVMMRTEPELQSGEALVVSLSADGVAVVSPTGPVTLTPANNAVPVTLEATRQPSALGAVSATLDENASLLGNARVTTEVLVVDVVRGVSLSLSGLVVQDSVRFAAGETTEVRVTTDPVLEHDERVTVTLSVDPRLSLESAGSALIDGNVLVLSAMNPSATVAVTAEIPGLNLADGVSASGVGENVGVVGTASLGVRTDASAEATVVLSPSPVIEVQQGGSTSLHVTTDPELGKDQTTWVTLTIEPGDAGFSFVTSNSYVFRSASSATITVLLSQHRPFLEIEVVSSSDAVIGNTAEVTSVVLENTQVEASTDVRSRVTLEATTPQVAIRFDPAPLELGLGTDKTVTLSFGDGFTLSGSQTAEFEVSVEGAGLGLEGDVRSIRVSFPAGESSTPISVTASADAVPVGRLVVRPVGGVELEGGMETASLPIEALQEVNLGFDPTLVLIPRSRSTQFKAAIDPPLVADRQTTVTLAISKQGFVFGGGRPQRETITFDAGKSSETVTVAATAAPGTRAAVKVEVTASSGVRIMGLPSLNLQATVPRAALDLTPAGGAPGNELVLNTGTNKVVTLSLPDLTLSGDHVAEFEVSVEGEGLSLQGGTPTPQVLGVRLSASAMTAEARVSASARAAAVGRLVVRPVDGVELAGGTETASLPIRVLQPVSLRFVPDSVEIQRGRDTQFVVEIDPSLVADRQTTVTLAISGQGFVFGAGDTRHEVTFDADKSRETVTVAATAEIDSMVSVSVGADTSSGVDLAPVPGLMLKATPPRVAVAFFPAGELRLTSGGEAPVELRLDGYSLIENQEIVLDVSVDDGELEVNPSRVTLTEAMPSAMVQVSASRSAESGNLMVSVVSGAELVGDTNLPVVVSPRELMVSFEPSAVRLVRGGAAAETTSTQVSLGVMPALEGDERLVLRLTSGVGGNLEVSPIDATLRSMVRTVPVRVTAILTTGSTEVVALEKSGTSIGNAVVSFTPLTVEVVRGVELSLLDHTGQAVEALTLVAGESTEITVATEPSLERDERVTVTLVVADDLTLPWGNELILTETNSSSRVRVSALSPGLNSANGVRVSVPGEGENVGVVGELPSLGFVTRVADKVTVVLPSAQVEVQQGRSAMLRVETDPLLGVGQAVTVRLTIKPADAGLSFAGGLSVTEVELGENRRSVDVEVTASTNVAIRSGFEVASTVVNAPVGLGVTIDARSETTLEVTTPRVVLGLRPAGGEIGEALTLNLGESKAVELRLTDFTLSGNQTASFEVSVSGGGLSLQGGTSNQQVSLDADDVTAKVTVMASSSADSTGELRVRALSGVELAGGVQAATLPVEVLQSVSLAFDPDLVLIQRGRSTEFEVAISPPLIADRQTTVTLTISEEGFSFDDTGNTQHEVVLDADKSSETVTVATTAEIDSMVSVSVDVTPSSGVRALTPFPSLTLKATTPRVTVRFDPSPLHLMENERRSLTISLQADGRAYEPVLNQVVVLTVAVEEGDLRVSTDPNPSAAGHPAVDISLSADSQTAMVLIIAEMPGTGSVTVSSDDVELVGDTELPITVRPPSEGTTLRIRVFLEGALE